jgi:hypothetical protein
MNQGKSRPSKMSNMLDPNAFDTAISAKPFLATEGLWTGVKWLKCDFVVGPPAHTGSMIAHAVCTCTSNWRHLEYHSSQTVCKQAQLYKKCIPNMEARKSGKLVPAATNVRPSGPIGTPSVYIQVHRTIMHRHA